MKPVSVISAPVRLSGRYCHAISPQAMNDPPTERFTTATAVTSASPRKRKNSAANSAAIPSGQSTNSSRASPAEGLRAHSRPSLRLVRMDAGTRMGSSTACAGCSG